MMLHALDGIFHELEGLGMPGFHLGKDLLKAFGLSLMELFSGLHFALMVEIPNGKDECREPYCFYCLEQEWKFSHNPLITSTPSNIQI